MEVNSSSSGILDWIPRSRVSSESTVQYSTVQYSTHYSTVYSTVRHSTAQPLEYTINQSDGVLLRVNFVISNCFTDCSRSAQ